ncbi:MAG: DUF559 domain-containing protein [Candidatus Firestonebacteria bacterium]
MSEIVLIAVLKNRKDLNVLLKEKWYRIPVFSLPKRKADYIAFYQPATFGKSGSSIRYYAEPISYKTLKRIKILPKEFDHPNANDEYYKLKFRKIFKLKSPVRNKSRMRISFGFTTFEKLKRARNITELFDVNPIEDMLGLTLGKHKIKSLREHTFRLSDCRRYRLDFVIFCKRGPLNIEGDSSKWHSIKSQRLKDALRDMALRKSGWCILRLKEPEIIGNIDKCVLKIRRAIKKLGGPLVK